MHARIHPPLRALALLLTLAGCAGSMLAGCAGQGKLTTRSGPPAPAADAKPEAEAVPTARLGRNVIPTHYTLELGILPALERFNGRTTIRATVAEPTKRIYLHGDGLAVSDVSLVAGEQTMKGRYSQVDPHGVAALDFDAPVPAGEVTLTLTYDAPFGKQLRGLYRVESEGNAYAFTQFEATSARAAFPCFDEPAFKTPFDVWLTVPEGDTAIANGPAVAEEPLQDGYRRVHFAQTQPLPTYLVAFAVGPLDVVEAKPLPPNDVRDRAVPLRGVAIEGKGKQLAYALQHTPRMLEALEQYFGIPYPYDKLDIIAVPDFAAGAMENAGAITFRDWLLLFDEATALEKQRRAFAYVMAHELAHQWFGNYVTMPWWNDIWLNEAFATWMGHRIVAELYPQHHADTSFLQYVHRAMDADSLISARMIRQPVTSHDDIANAFDGITYSKGGGVLAMFERYLGEERFRAGIRAYLSARPFGTATAEDLIAALSGSDAKLSAAFSSFLDQTGVPHLKTELSCQPNNNVLTLTQERYLPLGSQGRQDHRIWGIPACVRYAAGGNTERQCLLMNVPVQTLTLPGDTCPTWWMPNADAAGYYRWTMPPDGLAQLRNAGFPRLNAREQLSLARNLRAGIDGGTMKAADVLAMLPTLVTADDREVTEAPMGLLSMVHDTLLSPTTQPKLQAFARQLYDPLQRKLGWRARGREDGEKRLLRASVMAFLADVGRYPRVRIKAAQLGRKYLGFGGDGKLHPKAVPADLAALAVRIAVEDGDAAVFDAALSHFRTTGDTIARGHLLRALSSVRDGRAARALALSLDPDLRVNEVLVPVSTQLSDERTRESAWQWFVEHFDALSERLSARNMGHTPWLASGFCDTAHAERMRVFFEPRLEKLTGGPRALSGAIEAINLCVARRQAQAQSAEQFFVER